MVTREELTRRLSLEAMTINLNRDTNKLSQKNDVSVLNVETSLAFEISRDSNRKGISSENEKKAKDKNISGKTLLICRTRIQS